MLGNALLFIPNLNEQESDYLGYFPNSNWNKFPDGTKFTDFVKNRDMGQFKNLKGGYLDINMFLRGGKIIPYQNNTNISSSIDLRFKRTSLIINPDQNNNAKGQVIYDNDEVDPIVNKTYLHMAFEFDKNYLKFYIINIGKKRNNNYDDIIEDIILYRASEINKNIFKNAEIQTLDQKKQKWKAEYHKEKDILILKGLKIPIYYFHYIRFE